jgi:hypothetical protein
MSYDEKTRTRRLDEKPAEPWDTAKHGAPDPAWSTEDQRKWLSIYSHVLLLNSSEHLRQSAAEEADKAVGRPAPVAAG